MYYFVDNQKLFVPVEYHLKVDFQARHVNRAQKNDICNLHADHKQGLGISRLQVDLANGLVRHNALLDLRENKSQHLVPRCERALNPLWYIVPKIACWVFYHP
jgi:hypothetical protein